jgi:hypothetical protein
MHLSFSDEDLHRLCCRRKTLDAQARKHASCLARLLNEIACAETLAVLDTLPHVELVARRHLVAVTCEPVEVLLAVDGAARIGKTTTPDRIWSAKAARIVALAIDGKDFNPEGAKWPQ